MIALSELRDAAQKAFPADKLASPRDAAWRLVAEQGWLMITLPEDLGGLGLWPRCRRGDPFRTWPRAVHRAADPGAAGAGSRLRHSECLADKGGWIERICGGEYVPLNMLPGAVDDDAGGTLTGRMSGFFEADMAGHVLAGDCRAIPADPHRCAGRDAGSPRRHGTRAAACSTLS